MVEKHKVNLTVIIEENFGKGLDTIQNPIIKGALESGARDFMFLGLLRTLFGYSDGYSDSYSENKKHKFDKFGYADAARNQLWENRYIDSAGTFR